MVRNRIVVACADNNIENADFKEILVSCEFALTFVENVNALTNLVQTSEVQLIFICSPWEDEQLVNFSKIFNWQIPIVVVLPLGQQQIDRVLLHAGVVDFIELPATKESIIETVQRVSERRFSASPRRSVVDLEKMNQTLLRQLRSFKLLLKIARSISTVLDGDAVLNRITESAVFMTGAEEGYLLLVDDASKQLQLRAAQNLGEKQSYNFNIDIQDSIAGQVVQSGEPLLLGGNTARLLKVKTGLLVKSLLNVPLVFQGRVIGVLGVDNQKSTKEFSSYHLQQLTYLASIATTAIENTRQYNKTRVALDTYVREFDLLQSLVKQQLKGVTNFEVGAQKVLSLFLNGIDADVAMMHWLQDETQEPIFIFERGISSEKDKFSADTLQRWYKDGLLQPVLDSDEPTLYSQLPERLEEQGTCLFAPLKDGDYVVGAILFFATKENVFSVEDLYLLANSIDYIVVVLNALQLRQQAQNDRQRLQSLLDVVDNGVWFFDNDLHLIMQNRVASDLIGKSLDEAIGASIDELLPSDDGSPHLVTKLARQVLRERHPITFSNSLVQLREQEEPILVAGYVMPDFYRNEVKGVVCTVWEAVPMQSNEHSEREFTQMASHLFRTPIGIIQSSIDLLLDLSFDERERSDILKGMRIQGQRLVDITNELLKILRIEADGIVARCTPIDITPIVNRALMLVRDDSPYITFERVFQDKLSLALGDGAKTELVVFNLLLNAIRRCVKGGHIIISVYNTSDQVVIQVEDTGTPLTREEKQRIFRQFYPVDDYFGEKMPSTYNFGLYNVKRLVTLQRGKIGVDSEPGATTKFFFSLPIWEGNYDKNTDY